MLAPVQQQPFTFMEAIVKGLEAAESKRYRDADLALRKEDLEFRRDVAEADQELARDTFTETKRMNEHTVARDNRQDAPVDVAPFLQPYVGGMTQIDPRWAGPVLSAGVAEMNARRGDQEMTFEDATGKKHTFIATRDQVAPITMSFIGEKGTEVRHTETLNFQKWQTQYTAGVQRELQQMSIASQQAIARAERDLRRELSANSSREAQMQRRMQAISYVRENGLSPQAANEIFGGEITGFDFESEDASVLFNGNKPPRFVFGASAESWKSRYTEAQQLYPTVATAGIGAPGVSTGTSVLAWKRAMTSLARSRSQEAYNELLNTYNVNDQDFAAYQAMGITEEVMSRAEAALESLGQDYGMVDQSEIRTFQDNIRQHMYQLRNRPFRDPVLR